MTGCERCGQPITFGTDSNGGVVEECRACGLHIPMRARVGPSHDVRWALAGRQYRIGRHRGVPEAVREKRNAYARAWRAKHRERLSVKAMEKRAAVWAQRVANDPVLRMLEDCEVTVSERAA